jgi:hypothetical protein
MAPCPMYLYSTRLDDWILGLHNFAQQCIHLRLRPPSYAALQTEIPARANVFAGRLATASLSFMHRVQVLVLVRINLYSSMAVGDKLGC